MICNQMCPFWFDQDGDYEDSSREDCCRLMRYPIIDMNTWDQRILVHFSISIGYDECPVEKERIAKMKEVMGEE